MAYGLQIAFIFKLNGILNIENAYLKKHTWHPEHRKNILKGINGIQNIQNVYFKTYMPENRKGLFLNINGIQNIETADFKP